MGMGEMGYVTSRVCMAKLGSSLCLHSLTWCTAVGTGWQWL